MLNNQQRREILNAAKATGHQGSVLDLFAQAEAGVDVPTLLHAEQDAKRQMEAQQMQVARTQQEQQAGLREEHARGNTGASMAFPDVAPNASFNTEGMKVPINISKFDQQGHLVQSFKDVPPGVQNLPTGPGRGTVIETPAYKYGGYKKKYQNAGFNINNITFIKKKPYKDREYNIGNYQQIKNQQIEDIAKGIPGFEDAWMTMSLEDRNNLLNTINRADYTVKKSAEEGKEFGFGDAVSLAWNTKVSHLKPLRKALGMSRGEFTGAIKDSIVNYAQDKNPKVDPDHISSEADKYYSMARVPLMGLSYRQGGPKKYQGGGPDAEVDILDLDKNANPFTYHEPTKNKAILESNKAGLGTEGLDVTYINPDNIQSLSSNVTPEEWEMIQDAQGAYPLGEAVVGGDFEPQDIPKGYDPYANNSMEQKIFDNLGMDGVLRYRQQKAGQHAATEPVGAWGSAILGGGAVLGSVGALPGLTGVTTPSALASGTTRLVTAGPRYFGNKFLTHTGQALTGVEGGFGSYLGALRSGQLGGQGLRTLTPFQRANSGLMSTYYGKTFAGLPGAVNKMYEGAGAEFTGKGDLGTRSRFVEGFADVLPYSKGAGFLRNQVLGGVTPLELTKFGEAFDRGDYTEMGARGLAFGFKGDQSGLVDQGKNLLSTAISTGRKFNLFDPAVDVASGFASDAYTGATDYIANLSNRFKNLDAGDQGYQDFLTGQETERVNPGSQRMGGPRMYQNGGPVDTDPVEDYVRRYLNDKFNIDYDKLLDNQKQELRRRAIQDARYLEQTKTRPDLYPELNFNKS